MDTPVRVALAVGGGYVLGRTKKMKLALTVGSMIAGRKMTSSDLLAQGLDVLRSSPEFDRLREQLTGAGRTAAMSAAAASLSRLSDRIEAGGRQGSEDSADEGADDGAEDRADQGAQDSSADEGAEDSADDSADEGTDDGAEDSADEGTEDSADEGADDSADEGADDSADEGADDSADDEPDASSRGSGGRGNRRAPEGRPARATSRPRSKGEGGSSAGRATTSSGGRRAGAGSSRGGDRG